MIVQFRDRAAGSESRWSRIKAQPVRDADGAVRLAINVIEDVTELKQVEQAQRFLAEAGRVLAGSLDYEETLRHGRALAVPELADWCGVDLAGDRRRGSSASRSTHVDPAKVALAQELAERYPRRAAHRPRVHQVLRTGESQLWPRHPRRADRRGAPQDEEHLRLIRALGMRSAMIVPMRVRDRVLGAITFVSAESGRTLRRRRPAARRGPRAARRRRRSRTRACTARARRSRSTLQASLLPPMLPEIPGVEAGALYRAAGEGTRSAATSTTSSRPPSDEWFAVIGDVCGKGAEAAAVTALARYTIRAAAVRRRSPAAILRWLNDAMLRQDARRALLHDRLRAPRPLAPARPRSRSPAAATRSPLVLRADGSVEELGAPGTLLGLVDDPQLEDATHASSTPGDALVLYTDGLTEAGAPQRVWTPEDLDAALRGAAGGTRAAARRPPRRRGAAGPGGAAARRHRDARAAPDALVVLGPGRSAVLVVGRAVGLAAGRVVLGVAAGRRVVDLARLLLGIAGAGFLRCLHALGLPWRGARQTDEAEPGQRSRQPFSASRRS